MSFHIYSDIRRRPNCGRQGKIFKIDISTLLQMAFLGPIKALVMWLSLKRLSISAIFRDFHNYDVKYNRRVVKTYLTWIKTFKEILSLKLNLKIEFWLPSNGSQLVAAWTPAWVHFILVFLWSHNHYNKKKRRICLICVYLDK